MNANKTLILFMLACMPSFIGCSYLEQSRINQARKAHQFNQMQRKIAKMEDAVQGMEQSRERLFSRVDDVERLASSSERQLSQEVAALKTEITALRAERQALRQQLVKDLSGKMAHAIKQYAEQSSATQSRNGRLHTVQQGETLSEIARAYGCTIKAIMRANKLSSPDKLKIGQELFIPE